MMSERTFEAVTGFFEDGTVWVCEDGKRVAKLNPRFDVVNHSPTGFAWGYGGSGPAQLACAILVAVVGAERAIALHQNYKAVIAKLDKDKGFTIRATDVKLWAEAQP